MRWPASYDPLSITLGRDSEDHSPPSGTPASAPYRAPGRVTSPCRRGGRPGCASESRWRKGCNHRAGRRELPSPCLRPSLPEHDPRERPRGARLGSCPGTSVARGSPLDPPKPVNGSSNDKKGQPYPLCAHGGICHQFSLEQPRRGVERARHLARYELRTRVHVGPEGSPVYPQDLSGLRLIAAHLLQHGGDVGVMNLVE